MFNMFPFMGDIFVTRVMIANAFFINLELSVMIFVERTSVSVQMT